MDLRLLFFERSYLFRIADRIAHRGKGIFELLASCLRGVIFNEGFFMSQAHVNLVDAFQARERASDRLDAKGTRHPADFELGSFHFRDYIRFGRFAGGEVSRRHELALL